MPFPPINLHSRISSPGKDLFRKKKPVTSLVPPQSLLNPKPREEKEPEKDKLSTSWPSANLRQLGRKPQQQHHHHHHQQQHQQEQQHSSKFPTDCSIPNLDVMDLKNSWLNASKPLDGSCESVTRSSSGESAARRAGYAKEELEQEVQFSLSLTPEAILVIQKRNLEKQMLAKQQKCCSSTDAKHRRAAVASKRTQGAPKSTGLVAKADSSNDISAIVKISLLNDQHKYDDVEYEEEDGDVDETVMRKCKEWLKGVESAAAFSKVDKLSALPHLKSC
ncbi:proline-rich protein 18 [Silurus asotus]|uniref:Proline-rich protein 18 n=1 Tax=Silurus asotus TaxID=30991 RepID=A0AAD5FCF6_SILAS|nr:proline-rich protein 18 [Silurus asotus]